jgi:hypothetical protein
VKRDYKIINILLFSLKIMFFCSILLMPIFALKLKYITFNWASGYQHGATRAWIGAASYPQVGKARPMK